VRIGGWRMRMRAPAMEPTSPPVWPAALMAAICPALNPTWSSSSGSQLLMPNSVIRLMKKQDHSSSVRSA
jgi:hypothetical protein